MTRTTTPSVENQREIAFTTEIFPEGQPPVILYFNVHGKFIGTGTIRDTFEPGVRDEENGGFTANTLYWADDDGRKRETARSNRGLSIETGY
jgi:hypothetical protein